jgi:hypothetical protein
MRLSHPTVFTIHAAFTEHGVKQSQGRSDPAAFVVGGSDCAKDTLETTRRPLVLVGIRDFLLLRPRGATIY